MHGSGAMAGVGTVPDIGTLAATLDQLVNKVDASLKGLEAQNIDLQGRLASVEQATTDYANFRASSDSVRDAAIAAAINTSEGTTLAKVTDLETRAVRDVQQLDMRLTGLINALSDKINNIQMNTYT